MKHEVWKVRREIRIVLRLLRKKKLGLTKNDAHDRKTRRGKIWEQVCGTSWPMLTWKSITKTEPNKLNFECYLLSIPIKFMLKLKPAQKWLQTVLAVCVLVLRSCLHGSETMWRNDSAADWRALATRSVSDSIVFQTSSNVLKVIHTISLSSLLAF